MTVLINHVMSTNVKSSIFRDFIFRIKENSLSCFQHTVSIEPKSYADIYHFHRPQKCDIEQIPEKSLVTLHLTLLILGNILQWKNFFKTFAI